MSNQHGIEEGGVYRVADRVFRKTTARSAYDATKKRCASIVRRVVVHNAYLPSMGVSPSASTSGGTSELWLVKDICSNDTGYARESDVFEQVNPVEVLAALADAPQ